MFHQLFLMLQILAVSFSDHRWAERSTGAAVHPQHEWSVVWKTTCRHRLLVDSLGIAYWMASGLDWSGSQWRFRVVDILAWVYLHVIDLLKANPYPITRIMVICCYQLIWNSLTGRTRLWLTMHSKLERVGCPAGIKDPLSCLPTKFRLTSTLATW